MSGHRRWASLAGLLHVLLGSWLRWKADVMEQVVVRKRRSKHGSVEAEEPGEKGVICATGGCCADLDGSGERLVAGNLRLFRKRKEGSDATREEPWVCRQRVTRTLEAYRRATWSSYNQDRQQGREWVYGGRTRRRWTRAERVVASKGLRRMGAMARTARRQNKKKKNWFADRTPSRARSQRQSVS